MFKHWSVIMLDNTQLEKPVKIIFVGCQYAENDKTFNPLFKAMLTSVLDLIENLKNNYGGDDYDYILSSLEEQASFYKKLI